MIGDPGSKFDFGTLIAYLIPGYLAEFFLFALIDTTSILVYKESLLSEATWDLVTVAIAGALLSIIGYILGLFLDLIAHPITLSNELKLKDSAYKLSVNNFKSFIKNSEIRNILYSSEGDILDTSRRDLLIDSMYYRLATPEIWSRQNWHWAFYEFSRQMYLLSVPLAAVSAFYITSLVLLFISPKQESSIVIWISLGVTVIVSLINWFLLRPLLKRANKDDGEVYYRHRAWVLFSYLIENELMPKSANKESQNRKK